jgi:hypothetical protein
MRDWRRHRRGCGGLRLCCHGWLGRGRGRRNNGSCNWRRGPARSRFRRGFFRGAFGFGGGFGVRYTLQVLLNFFRDIGGNGAGVRFLFGNAESGQKVNDGFRLDLEFARELIDTDLICVAHAS